MALKDTILDNDGFDTFLYRNSLASLGLDDWGSPGNSQFGLSASQITTGYLANKIILAGQSPSIQSGKTLYDNTQTGFILGLDGGTAKFYIGSTTQYLNWTGTDLVITGTIYATAGEIGGWTISTNELSSGNVHINSANEQILMGSATAPLTGTGVFIGLDGSDYEFRVGNPSGSYAHWDGTNYNIYIPNGSIQTNANTPGNPGILIQGGTFTLYDDTTGGSSPVTGTTAALIYKRTDDDDSGTNHPEFYIQRRASEYSDNDNVIEMFFNGAALGGRYNTIYFGWDGEENETNVYGMYFTASTEYIWYQTGFTGSLMSFGNDGGVNSRFKTQLRGTAPEWEVGRYDTNDVYDTNFVSWIGCFWDTIVIGTQHEETVYVPKTTNEIQLKSYRKLIEASTETDDYDAVLIVRTSEVNALGAQFNTAGSACKIQNIITTTDGTSADTTIALKVIQNSGLNAAGTGGAVDVVNGSTGTCVKMDQTAVLANSKYGLEVYSNAANVNSSNLVYIHEDNASSTHNVFYLTNDGTGSGIDVNQVGALVSTKYAVHIHSNTAQTASYLLMADSDHADSTADVAYIKNDGTGDALNIDQNGVLASGKYALHVYSNAIQINEPLVYIHQDNTGSTKMTFRIDNGSTGDGLYIQQDGVLSNSGQTVKIYSNTASTNTSHLLTVSEDNANSTHNVIFAGNTGTGHLIFAEQSGNSATFSFQLKNSGTGSGTYILQNAVLAANKYGFVVSSASNETTGGALSLFQLTSASSTIPVIDINNDGTGHGLYIHCDGVLAASRYGLYIVSDSANTNGGAIAHFKQDSASATDRVVYVYNDGTGDSIYSDNNGTGTNCYLRQDGVLGAGDYALYVYSNAVQTTSPLCYIQQDNASSTKPLIQTKNDGSGSTIYDNTGALLTAAGVWTDAVSFKKYKTKKDKLDNVLDKLDKLECDIWQYKDEELDGMNRYSKDQGYHCFPYHDQFYEQFGLGMLHGVQAMEYIGVLIKAIQELHNEVKALKIT